MASSAAQTYFNSFIPEQQAQIKASWGGADLMDEWFKNAMNAGAAKPDGTPNQGQGATQASQAAGGMTPQKLKEKAKAEGWSEDFARFDDATLQGWINSNWDPQRGKFRSQHAPPGATGDWIYVEKPTEGIVDPSTGTEWGPHGDKSGVNLSALGLNTLKGSIGAGGKQGTKTPGAPSDEFDTSYLQNKLVEQMQHGAGFFGSEGNNLARLNEGGVWWSDPGEQQIGSGLPGAASPTPAAPGAPPPAVPPAQNMAMKLAGSPLFGGGGGGGTLAAASAPLFKSTSNAAPEAANTQVPSVAPLQPMAPTRVPASSAAAQKMQRIGIGDKLWK